MSAEEPTMKTARLFVALLAAGTVILAVSPAVQALDTDIYLKSSGSASQDDSPNVLIILDNSGSMSDVISSGVPYNPSTTYTYQGTGTAFDTSKIYWITSSQAEPTSADTYVGQWISVSNNQCTSSTVPNASNATDTNGTYNVRAVKWNATSGWTALTTGDGRVDCRADNPADSSGTYVRKSSGGTAPATMYTNSSSQVITWSSSMTVTMYSGNYLNYRTNPSSGPMTKLDIAKQVVNNVIDSNPGVRIGMMSFNYNGNSDSVTTDSGGRVVFAVQDMNATNRATLHTIVNSYNPDTWTPLAETLYEAKLYLTGDTPRYGNFTNPTNPVADPAAKSSSGNYISPFKYSCQNTYIIIVTDGDPTIDANADTLIDALPGIGAPTITDAWDSSHMDRLAVLAGWMYNNDLSNGTNGLAGNQRAVTYTVGFNAGGGISSQGLALLSATATAGHGAFYTASDLNSLNSALQAALINIQTQSASFAAPGLSVNAFNTLFNRDEVYFAMFKPTGSKRWDGNVKKYKLCTDTSSTGTCKYGEVIDYNGNPAVSSTTYKIKDTAVSYWSQPTQDGSSVESGGAGSKLPGSSTRKIYTYTGSYDANKLQPSGGAPVSLASDTINTSNTGLTPTLMGVSTSTDVTNMINWILGKDVFQEDSTSTTADRVWRNYDPMHSRPVIVNYGGTNTSPVMKIFVGTNDGMLHMINENTGAEEWAFLPQELLAQQHLIGPNSSGDHIWGVDGTPYVDIYDANGDGIIDPSTDYVHVYFGLRRGGRNIYALDVTPASILTSPSATGGITPKLMWVIQGGVSTGYGSLGQTWSRPTIANIRTGTGGSGASATSQNTKVLMFAGGYDPANDSSIPAPTTSMGNAIYIVNPLTGQRIWWASNTGADLNLTNMQFSIPSDLTLMDANGDGAIDRIYVGDVGGQIWRIDLSPTLKLNNNGGSSGYVFADVACSSGSRPTCSGTSNQARRRFFYPPDVAQVNDSIYSSVAKYDIVTIGSGDREDPLDLHTSTLSPAQDPVHNRLYALRDYNINAMSTGGSITYPATIVPSDLYDATPNNLQNATSTQINTSGIKSDKGWFISFVDSSGNWVGEKSLSRTNIFGGTLYATTFIPASATTTTVGSCTPNEGTGTLYSLNLLDGAADFDSNGDGTLDTSDRKSNVGGGIPSEHVVVIRPGGNSDLVGTAMPGNVKQGLQRDTIYWFQ